MHQIWEVLCHYVEDIFRLLGADDGFVPDASKRHKVSMVRRNHVAYDLVMGTYPLNGALTTMLPADVWPRLKWTSLSA